jgi:flagellar assembly protein FliH
MATVIRAARIEAERLVLKTASRASHAVRKAAAPVAAPAPTTTPVVAPVEPLRDVVAPRIHAERSAEGHAAYGIAPVVDRAAEEASFRERLEAERVEVLDKAEAEGFDAGVARGAASYAKELESLGQIIASARAALDTGIAGTEDVMVEIAFEAVCKILGDAMQRPEGVVAVVREVLSTMRERERLVVRVAPVDYDLLKQHRGQLLQGDDGKTIDLVADERLALGGCLVETTGGMLDGRLETQLQRLIETLTSARRMGGEST